MIKFDEKELETIYWVNIHELKKDVLNYSDMTRYWVNNLDWDKTTNKY